MADVFGSTQVADRASAFTAQDVQAQRSTTAQAISGVAELAPVVFEVGQEIRENKQLGELSEKFRRISEARQMGGNAFELQAKATSELRAAKTANPDITRQADQLFRNTFGGGGGGSAGGVFSLSPEEQAQADYEQKVTERALAGGYSKEEAIKRISLEDRVAHSQVLAEQEKVAKQANGDVIFSATQTDLVDSSIRFSTALSDILRQTGGSLDQNTSRDFNAAISQEALRMKQQLRENVTDGDGRPLVNSNSFNVMLTEIEDWERDQRTRIADNGYNKLISEINTSQNAEIEFVATKKYRTLKEIEAAGGQSAVKNYLDIASTTEGAKKEWLISNAEPQVQDMFRTTGSYDNAIETATDKVMGTFRAPNPEFISDPEAHALGQTLANPQARPIKETVHKSVADNPQAAKAYQVCVSKNPDMAYNVRTDDFNQFKLREPDRARKVLDTTMAGLKTSYITAYVSANGSLPQSVAIVEGTTEAQSRTLPGGVGTIRVVGEGIDSSTAKIAREMYATINKYPELKETAEAEAGRPLTTSEVVNHNLGLLQFQEPVDGVAARGEVIRPQENAGQAVLDALSDPSVLEQLEGLSGEDRLNKFNELTGLDGAGLSDAFRAMFGSGEGSDQE